MITKTSDWYETKVKYEKTQEDGSEKSVIEQYVVDAVNFAESEETVTNEMKKYISGEYKVVGISPASYHEIFFSTKDSADKWYKVKAKFVNVDLNSGKEKQETVYYLVQGSSLQDAVKGFESVMANTSVDYFLTSVQETKFMDVFCHETNTPKKNVRE